MKRAVLIGVGIVLATGLALALILPSLLDGEKHRPAIESAIAAATGRAVSLGPLKLSVLPLPELTARGITIGEDPRFGTEPFVTAERLIVRVRLAPLLRRQVRVVFVTVDRPELRIKRNREGEWSVLTLGRADRATRDQAPVSRSAGPVDAPAGALPSAGGTAGGFSFSAERIRIKNGTLRIVDEALVPGRTTTAEARDLAWTLTGLSLASAVSTDLSFDLAGIGRVTLRGRVGPFSPDAGGTLPVDLTLGLGGSAASLAGKLTGLRERVAIDAHLVTKKVALREIAPLLSLAGPLLPAGLARMGEVSLDATARGPVDDPARMSIEGKATVADLEFADPSLKQPITGIRGSVALRGDRVEISDFKAALGKSSVTGACTIARFEKPVIDVRLDAPMLDLDDLLSLLPAATPRTSPSAAGGGQPAAGRGSGTSSAAAGASGAPPGAPARSLLTEVTLRGDLSVAKARVMNLEVSSARAQLALEHGVARLTGIKVDLYGGRMAGDLTADVGASGPPFALTGRLDGVDFNALVTDLSKDLKGLVYGTLETSLDVRGRGLDTEALRRDLTGKGTLALRDGKLASFGMLKAVARALQAAGGRGIGEDETPFQSLAGRFDIANGKATTEDLTLDSPDLTLLGKGFVGLDLSLDLGVVAKFSPQVSTEMVAKTAGLKYLQDGEGRLELDLRVDGTLTAPSVAVDRAMIDRAAKAVAKEKVREQGKSLLKKLFERKK